MRYLDDPLGYLNYIKKTKQLWDDTKSIQSQLNSIFGRILTQEEFYLLAETWFTYMSKANEIDKIDNRFKEQVKAQKNSLSKAQKARQKEIAALESFVQEAETLTDYTNIDISAYKNEIEKSKTKLIQYQSDISRLNLQRGRKLNSNRFIESGYLATLFCAETLGLPIPKNKEKNPYITLLDVLSGLSKEKDIGDVRHQFSNTYQKYDQFKNSRFRPFINELLNAAHQDRSLENIRTINKNFQKKFLTT